MTLIYNTVQLTNRIYEPSVTYTWESCKLTLRSGFVMLSTGLPYPT